MYLGRMVKDLRRLGRTDKKRCMQNSKIQANDAGSPERPSRPSFFKIGMHKHSRSSSSSEITKRRKRSNCQSSFTLEASPGGRLQWHKKTLRVHRRCSTIRRTALKPPCAGHAHFVPGVPREVDNWLNGNTPYVPGGRDAYAPLCNAKSFSWGL